MRYKLGRYPKKSNIGSGREWYGREENEITDVLALKESLRLFSGISPCFGIARDNKAQQR